MLGNAMPTRKAPHLRRSFFFSLTMVVPPQIALAFMATSRSSPGFLALTCLLLGAMTGVHASFRNAALGLVEAAGARSREVASPTASSRFRLHIVGAGFIALAFVIAYVSLHIVSRLGLPVLQVLWGLSALGVMAFASSFVLDGQ
jgi:hypothetical protein